MTEKIIVKDQDGATLVEFALIVPLLFLLLFGTIEFGLFLFNKHIITNSSREGARAGIVARENRFVFSDTDNTLYDDIDIEGTVTNWIANHLVTFGGSGVPLIVIEVVDDIDDDPETPDSCDSATFYPLDDAIFDPDTGTGTPCLDYRCCLKVIVSYDYHFLFLSAFGIGPINMVAETVMLME
jgi:hypothetical protein